MNVTLEKFGYPNTLIKEYNNWCVVLRGKQPTLGSLVLIEKSDATSVSDISPESFSELKTITKEIETSLSKMFGVEKFNYLMLMMVDPNVHYHVIPRYSQGKSFEGVEFVDTGWPKHPNLGDVANVPDDVFQTLLKSIKANWAHL